jgi:hypothetical protein
MAPQYLPNLLDQLGIRHVSLFGKLCVEELSHRRGTIGKSWLDGEQGIGQCIGHVEVSQLEIDITTMGCDVLPDGLFEALMTQPEDEAGTGILLR